MKLVPKEQPRDAVSMTLAMILIAALACDAQATTAIHAVYRESIDADTAECQIEITEHGGVPAILQSAPFPATHTQADMAVDFSGPIPGEQPGAQYDVYAICRDAVGQLSNRSNAQTITIPEPTPVDNPPAAPQLKACSFTVTFTLPDGSTQVQTPVCVAP